MKIESKTFSLFYKSLIVAIGLAGLMGQFGLFSGEFNLYMLNYFTVLSNIAVVLYFLCDVVYIVHRPKGSKITPWKPMIKGMVTMSITVTFLIAHFILGMGFTMGNAMGLSLLAVHYIVPIMTIVDWVLFDEKGMIRKADPILWVIAPWLYLAFDMSTAGMRKEGVTEGAFMSAYIYPFLDVDRMGAGKVALSVLLLSATFILLGYIVLAMDYILAKLKKS